MPRWYTCDGSGPVPEVDEVDDVMRAYTGSEMTIGDRLLTLQVVLVIVTRPAAMHAQVVMVLSICMSKTIKEAVAYTATRFVLGINVKLCYFG